MSEGRITDSTVADDAKVDIVLCPGGPMLVRGDVVVQDAEGQRHRSTRPVSALCRCHRSARAPWCDGTHKKLPVDQRP